LILFLPSSLFVGVWLAQAPNFLKVNIMTDYYQHTPKYAKQSFARQTWVESEGHAAKTATLFGVNMNVLRVDVIVSNPTANPTVTVTFANADGVAVIDGTNFATLAKNTKHIKLARKATADFTEVPLVGDITVTIDPSLDSGATSLTVDVILYGD